MAATLSHTARGCDKESRDSRTHEQRAAMGINEQRRRAHDGEHAAVNALQDESASALGLAGTAGAHEERVVDVPAAEHFHTGGL